SLAEISALYNKRVTRQVGAGEKCQSTRTNIRRFRRQPHYLAPLLGSRDESPFSEKRQRVRHELLRAKIETLDKCRFATTGATLGIELFQRRQKHPGSER